jgi:hypothetical protein
MRAMAVVVIDVGVQDALELATTGHQAPVEALAPHGGDEALGKRVRRRRVDRCSDDLDPSLRKTSSKAPVNFESRSWIRKRGGEARSATDHGK